MADQKEYGGYKGNITNRQQKRLHKTDDYSKDNYNQDDYNPEMIAHVTPAGHKYLLDNTKGKERLLFKHMTGTGFEILKDGTRIHKVIGNEYQYIKGGLNTTVQENTDIKYAGHYRKNVDGGSHEEIKGNSTQYVGGSSAHHTVGNHTRTTTGNLTMGSEQAVVLTSKGKGQQQAQVTLSLGHDGTLYIESKGKHIVFKGAEDFMVETKNFGIKCDKFGIDCANDIDIKGGGKLNLEGTSSIDLHSGGKIKATTGDEIHLSSPHTFLSKVLAEIPQLKTTVVGAGSPANDGTDATPEHTDHFPEQPEGVKGEAPSDTTPDDGSSVAPSSMGGESPGQGIPTS